MDSKQRDPVCSLVQRVAWNQLWNRLLERAQSAPSPPNSGPLDQTSKTTPGHSS
jgi:hypothetical protein